jgi:hypothetical protein
VEWLKVLALSANPTTANKNKKNLRAADVDHWKNTYLVHMRSWV